QERQTGSLQTGRVTVPFTELAGNAAPQEKNVSRFALLDRLSPLLPPFGRFLLLLLLDLRSASAVGFDRLLPGHSCRVLDHFDLRAIALPLQTDCVNFHELLGRQQTVGDHTAIDQFGARIVRSRNEVAAAEPDIAEPTLTALLARFKNLLALDRQKLG